MRLFYVIFILAIFNYFAAFASQKAQSNAQYKQVSISFITGKKVTKLKPDFNPDNESLQKDLISNTLVKISSSVFLLLAFLSFLFIRNNGSNTKAVIKRLRYNYCCLFKMLYPKHVFW